MDNTDLLKKPQINTDERRFEIFSSESNKSSQRTRSTRIGRISTDAKSVFIRVIRAIRVLSHIKLTNNNGFFISIYELLLVFDSAIRTPAFICVHLWLNDLNRLFCFHNNHDLS